MDLGAHQLDLAEFLLGPLKAVRVVASNAAGQYDVEDTVSALFEFASGVQVRCAAGGGPATSLCPCYGAFAVLEGMGHCVPWAVGGGERAARAPGTFF